MFGSESDSHILSSYDVWVTVRNLDKVLIHSVQVGATAVVKVSVGVLSTPAEWTTPFLQIYQQCLPYSHTISLLCASLGSQIYLPQIYLSLLQYLTPFDCSL